MRVFTVSIDYPFILCFLLPPGVLSYGSRVTEELILGGTL